MKTRGRSKKGRDEKLEEETEARSRRKNAIGVGEAGSGGRASKCGGIVK